MPRPQFGENFRKGAKKTWETSREAQQGSSQLGWDRYPVGNDYEGSTVITTGVSDAGKAKGADFISFDTTFLGEPYEGQNVEKRFFFGLKDQSDDSVEQNLAKVVKWCKKLFPDLVDDISQCGTPNDFLDLLASDMEGIPVEHKFNIKEYSLEVTNRDGTKSTKSGHWCEFGEVLGTVEGTTAPDADDDEPEADPDEDETDEYVPEVSDWVKHQPKGKRTPLDYEVVAVDAKAKLVDLKHESGKVLSNIAWDLIDPIEDEE